LILTAALTGAVFLLWMSVEFNIIRRSPEVTRTS